MKHSLKKLLTGMSLSLASMGAMVSVSQAADYDTLINEYAALINAPFGYFLSLQGEINSGTLDPSKVSEETLLSELESRFAEIAGYPIDEMKSDFVQHKDLFVENYLTVINDYRDDIVAGGDDAFIPAFFRSELLYLMNESLVDQGVFAAASMRDSELLNADSSVKYLMSGIPTLDLASELLEKGERNTLTENVDGHLLHYRPMTLAPGCVACHAKSGVMQEVGAFGGALLISIAAE